MIQTDTSPINILPNFRDVSKDEFDFFVHAYNKMVDGIKMEKWLHVCWGRLHGQPLLGAGDVRAWDKSYPHLLDTNADTINMHMSYAGDEVLRVLKEYPTDKNIALGVIDISRFFVEKPEKVAEFARKATKYADPNKLYFTTDCGLITVLDRTVALYKLMALAKGIELARKELKVEVPAARTRSR
jgi:5-methyltetrahydropteroyltriglutamate--homocysteine methyltransferase